MTFDTFLDKINLPKSLIAKVNVLLKLNYLTYDKYAKALLDNKISENTYHDFSEIYKNDTYHNHELAIYLLSAYYAYDNYIAKGISLEIYFDTMSCFTRFINECYQKTGKIYFDRSFWTYRQVSMVLFRIGILEYEFTEDMISLHIPSDAILTDENIKKSLCMFDEFLNKFYPEFKNREIFCNSWLLSPVLKGILDDNSNILNFQKYFEITKRCEDALDVFEWVFKCSNTTPIPLLKEDTSLQRNIKAILLKGGKVGNAYGLLKKK